MYGSDIDDLDFAAPCRRPLYSRKALRRMTAEDRLDAAMANLTRTGFDRGGRAARTARMWAGTR